MGMEEILASIITPLLLLVFGWYWRVHPPKKPNYLYGYRTRRSMANQEIWEHANTLGAKMLIILGAILLTLTALLLIISPSYAMIVSLFLVFIGLGVGMYWCETVLNKHYDPNGNPKKQNKT